MGAVCFHEFVDTERGRSAALGKICQCRLDASRVVLCDELRTARAHRRRFPGKLAGEHAVAGTQVVAFLEERVVEVEGYKAALTAVYISSFIVLHARIICLSLSTEPLWQAQAVAVEPFGIVAAIVGASANTGCMCMGRHRGRVSILRAARAVRMRSGAVSSSNCTVVSQKLDSYSLPGLPCTRMPPRFESSEAYMALMACRRATRSGQNLHLSAAYGATDIAQAVVEADMLVVIIGQVFASLRGEEQRFAAAVFVGAYQGASARGSDNLVSVETQRSESSESAAAASFVPRAEGFRGVFDYGYSAFGGDCFDLVPLGRHAVEIHGHDGFRICAGGFASAVEGVGKGCRRYVHSVRLAVDEHRARALVRDRICRRRKGERLAHHFVVFAYAEAYKGRDVWRLFPHSGKELLVLCEVMRP